MIIHVGRKNLCSALLFGGSQRLVREKAVATVSSSEKKSGLEEATSLTLLQHTIDVDKTRLSGRWAVDSHQLDPVLILHGFQRL